MEVVIGGVDSRNDAGLAACVEHVMAMYTSIRELRMLIVDLSEDSQCSEKLVNFLSKLVDKLEELDGRTEDLEELVK